MEGEEVVDVFFAAPLRAEGWDGQLDIASVGRTPQPVTKTIRLNTAS